MRLVLILIFTFVFSCSFAQDFKNVDATVLKYPKRFSQTTELSSLINRDFDSDSNKARAVYTWMINNIAYSYQDNGVYDSLVYYDIGKYYRTVAKAALRNGRGVCEDFSRLFHQLCVEVGVKCFTVGGYAKNELEDIGADLEFNHAWNIIVLRNKKYLIDVTWGAGAYNDHFIRDTTYLYFMTKPYIFLRKHYPAITGDMLVHDKIKWEEFTNAPLYYRNDEQAQVQLVYPLKGVLKSGNEVTFKLYNKLSDVTYSYAIGDGLVQDVEVNREGRFDVFTIDLKAVDKEEELVVYMNNKALLGFRLLVK